MTKLKESEKGKYILGIVILAIGLYFTNRVLELRIRNLKNRPITVNDNSA